jgi:ribonucleotide reductase alpha subunit
MRAVERDAGWDLSFEGKKYKTIRARDLYELIMKNMFEHNEPGIFFLDEVQRNNSGISLYGIDACNPCFTGEMKLLTAEGYKSFSEIVDKEIDIVDRNKEVSKGKIWCSGEKRVLELSFSNGDSLSCTPDHRLLVNEEWIEAKDCLFKKLTSFNGEEIEIVGILDRGVEKVYDFSEPNTHAGWVENVCVHNCGEQPLPEYGCCCLGAINLTEFVKNPFTESAYFDLDGFQEVIGYSVRFLDNVLSASDYPLEKIRTHVLNERRIGLGFTGFGDAKAMLRIVYGSEESKKFSKMIGSNLRDYSYLASTELAKEKGSFPLFNPSMLNDGFYKTLPAFIKEKMTENGMRNIALNTVAPTGCLTDDTVIQTTIGDLSIKEIFFLNELETGDVKDFQGEWIIPDKEIFVDTLEGEKRITKLFINGEKEVLEIKTKNSKIEGTLNHRVLVKISDEYAVWKELSELEEGDKILLKK